MLNNLLFSYDDRYCTIPVKYDLINCDNIKQLITLTLIIINSDYITYYGTIVERQAFQRELGFSFEFFCYCKLQRFVFCFRILCNDLIPLKVIIEYLYHEKILINVKLKSQPVKIITDIVINH